MKSISIKISRMKKTARILCRTGAVMILSLLSCSESWSAVKPLYTRAVAMASAKETSVDIINESQQTYMVQSWLEDLNGSDKNIPVVLTPPVMRLEGGRQGKLRLVVIPGQIPQDRESVYWLNIQEIPPKAKTNGKNILTIAVRSRIKVFVRPDALANRTEEITHIVDQLRWRVEKSGRQAWLIVDNPTPFYISFGELTVKSGKQVADITERFNMAPPKASQRYRVPTAYVGKNVTVTYRSINDYGGISKAGVTTLQL